MSYRVLARKWRPKNFSELMGQDQVKQILVNSLKNKKIHQGYVFSGNRGIGKTTIARILAKCLNCATKGLSPEPCGTCTRCRAIDSGSYSDLLEIDAASRGKVDDTRALIESALYAPSQGEYKVFLIDEAHMLTDASFNALLKILEEPPEHSEFILATTEPEQIPATILSRCLHFNMRMLLPEQIVDQLKKIFTAEQVGYDEQSLWLLARAAEGSMRDALSISEQAIAYTSNELSGAAVTEMLGIVGVDSVCSALRLVQGGDSVGLFQLTAELGSKPFNHRQFLDDFVTLVHRAAVAQACGGTQDSADYKAEVVQAVALASAPEDLQLYWQIALQGKKDLELTQDPMTALEMALLRMIAFRPSGELPKPSKVDLVPVAGVETVDQPDETATPSPPVAPELVPEPKAIDPAAAEAVIPEAVDQPAPEPVAPEPPAPEPPDTLSPELAAPEATLEPASPPTPAAPIVEPAPKAKTRRRWVFESGEVVNQPNNWQQALISVDLAPELLDALRRVTVQSVAGGQWELVSDDVDALNQLKQRQDEVDAALTNAFRETVSTYFSSRRRSLSSTEQAMKRLSGQLGFQRVSAD